HLTVAYLKPGAGTKYVDQVTGLEGSTHYFNRINFSDKDRNKTHITVNTRWQFRTNSQKLAEFLLWLNTRIERDSFAVTRDEIENAFWARYVEEGYRKGAGRAFDDARRLDRFDKQDRTGAGVSDFCAGSKA